MTGLRLVILRGLRLLLLRGRVVGWRVRWTGMKKVDALCIVAIYISLDFLIFRCIHFLILSMSLLGKRKPEDDVPIDSVVPLNKKPKGIDTSREPVACSICQEARLDMYHINCSGKHPFCTQCLTRLGTSQMAFQIPEPNTRHSHDEPFCPRFDYIQPGQDVSATAVDNLHTCCICRNGSFHWLSKPTALHRPASFPESWYQEQSLKLAKSSTESLMIKSVDARFQCDFCPTLFDSMDLYFNHVWDCNQKPLECPFATQGCTTWIVRQDEDQIRAIEKHVVEVCFL